MHFVNRGAEPTELKRYRDRYTQPWVNHYELKSGAKPSDSHWEKFLVDLREKFSGNCGYCETNCKGEVDHFLHKSSFPRLVYEWSNWIFSCHDCNNWKGIKGRPGEYIDPCAKNTRSRPEKFFCFDLKTGEILPQKELTTYKRKKARKMSYDLHLNAFHHLQARLLWIKVVSEVLKNENKGDTGHKKFIQIISSRDCPFSSITRVLLAEQGY